MRIIDRRLSKKHRFAIRKAIQVLTDQSNPGVTETLEQIKRLSTFPGMLTEEEWEKYFPESCTILIEELGIDHENTNHSV